MLHLFRNRVPMGLFCSHKPTPPHSKGIQIVDQLEDEAEARMQEEISARLHQLEKKHQETQDLIDSKIKFPFKLCGTKDRYEARFGYLPERIMSYYRIPQSRINDYLLKMYKASLFAIADDNTEYMNEYWEAGFMNETKKAIVEARSKGLTIKVDQDENHLQNVSESCEILDSVMIRGLSMNREENQQPSEYVRYPEPEQIGLITYTPKVMTGNNESFINPTKNKTVFEGYDKMLLRTLVRIRSPLRLNMPQFNVPEEVYTWEHICVFQNQMVAPKHLESAYKLQTLMEWMGKYRFGPWRVVDLDNFMRGNSPFRLHQQEEEQIDPIFKGSKLDKSAYIDIRMI